MTRRRNGSRSKTAGSEVDGVYRSGAPQEIRTPKQIRTHLPMRLDEPPQISGFEKLKLMNCAKCARAEGRAFA